MKFVRACSLLSIVAAASCSGKSGTESADSSREGAGGDDLPLRPVDPDTEAACKGVTERPPAKAAMRRLSWSELSNAWKDLFPSSAVESLKGEVDDAIVPSRTAQTLAPNESFLRSYHESLTTFSAREGSRWAKENCAAGEADCLLKGLFSKARLAWRRELTSVDKEFLSKTLAGYQTQVDADVAFGHAMRIVLGSPSFVFLTPPGTLANGDTEKSSDGKSVAKAKGQQLAGLLASAIWASIPDDELMDAAAKGTLDDSAGRSKQVERMLVDQKAERGLATFFRSWLGYNRVIGSLKDDKLFPDFDEPARRQAMEDTERTILSLVADNEPPEALLTSAVGFPGDKLSKALGWASEFSGGNKKDLSSLGRVGVATHPSILAVTSKPGATSVVNRGRFFVQTMACEDVPDPPPSADVAVAELQQKAEEGKISSRELTIAHSTEPSCANCHKYLDPFGLAFEKYDPIGRLRTKENGFDIDDSVTIDDIFGLNGTYAGPIPLLSALAETGRTSQCFARRFAAFTLVQPIEEEQLCALSDLVAKGDAPSMQDIIKRFVNSDLFLARSVN